MTDAPNIEQLSVLVAALGPGRFRTDLAKPRLTIHHELAMAKSALLYADRAAIASPAVSRVAMMAAASVAAASGDVQRASAIVQALLAGEGHVARIDERTALAVASRYGDEVDRMLADDPTWEEFGRAFREGLLTIQPFAGREPRRALAEMLHVLEHGVPIDASWTVMMDEMVGQVIETGVALGMPYPRAALGSIEIAVARELIGTIPAFPNATMDEVLDARRSLSVSITRFRASVAAIAREIDVSAPPNELDKQVAQLFRRDVAPALASIEDAAREAGLWSALCREARESSGGRILTATATIAIGAAADLTTIAQAALGAAAVAVDVLGATARRQRESRATQSSNGFFWLYRARQIMQ